MVKEKLSKARSEEYHNQLLNWLSNRGWKIEEDCKHWITATSDTGITFTLTINYSNDYHCYYVLAYRGMYETTFQLDKNLTVAQIKIHGER